MQFSSFFSINFSNGPKHNRESLMKTYKDSPLDDLITGKLPCQVINAVFMFAKNNAIFHNQIWPALKNRKGTTAAELRDFSIIRNEVCRKNYKSSHLSCPFFSIFPAVRVLQPTASCFYVVIVIRVVAIVSIKIICSFRCHLLKILISTLSLIISRCTNRTEGV